MTNFFEIPRRIPRRCIEVSTQSIPRVIWQTMKSRFVPRILKDYVETWIELNPEYEYRFFDDGDIQDFINQEFPEFRDGYRKISIGAMKSDFWRYLVIYKYGGVYADIDCRCINSLKNWISPGASWVTQLGTNRDVCQWLIISEAENPVLLRAAELSYENLIHGRSVSRYRGFVLDEFGELHIRKAARSIEIDHPVMKIAGPPILQEASEECFLKQGGSSVFERIQVICVSDTESCQMAGNVCHDYRNPDYLQALKSLSTKHYEDSIR